MNRTKPFNSQQRVLDLYRRLTQGEKIDVVSAGKEYGSSHYTLKDDIAKIRSVFDDRRIPYDHRENVYWLEMQETLKVEEAFVLLSILYESRSLPRPELKPLADHVCSMLQPNDRLILKKIMRSFDFYHVPFPSSPVMPAIRLVLQAIAEQRLLAIRYRSRNSFRELSIAPLSLAYYNSAYYAMVQLAGRADRSPLRLRLDRMTDCKLSRDKFEVNNQDDRFKAGEHANLTYNMRYGTPMKVTLRVVDWMEEYVLRDFPTAQVRVRDGNGVILEVTTAGHEGVLDWVMAQQDRAEVLSPDSLRGELKQRLQKMMDKYTNKPDKELS